MTYAFRFSCGHTSSAAGPVDEWLDCDWPCVDCRRAEGATVEEKPGAQTLADAKLAQATRPSAQVAFLSAQTDVAGYPRYLHGTVAAYQWPVTLREEAVGEDDQAARMNNTPRVDREIAVAEPNLWMLPDAEPLFALADGTPLYHACWPIEMKGQQQRAVSWWDGTRGCWVVVTLEGKMYQQQRRWSDDIPKSDKWEEIKLG